MDINNRLLGRSATHAVAAAAGAQFTEVAGWLLAEVYATPDSEARTLRDQVGLVDASANGRLVLEGHRAPDALADVWDVPSLEVGQGVLLDGREFFRLRPDRFLLRTAPGSQQEAIEALVAVAGNDKHPITILDVTAGHAELHLVGPSCATLLARLCGLDLHPDSFPDLAARHTSVAKTAQVVVRQDIGSLSSFALVGPRSLAAYLWQALLVAGRDLAVQPVGWRAYSHLRSSAPSPERRGHRPTG